jgi:hypothetical protein
MAVFELLSKKIMEGKTEDVGDCFPGAANIWPESYKTLGTVRH